MALWELVFGWLPSQGMRELLLGFLAFAFIIALVKFIKR